MARKHFVLILAIVLSEAVAQYHLKKSKAMVQRLATMYYFAVAIVAYGTVCVLLRACYEFKGVGLTNLVWSVLSIVCMLLIGFLFFHEHLTMYDGIGVMLCIAGLYFIFMFKHAS